MRRMTRDEERAAVADVEHGVRGFARRVAVREDQYDDFVQEGCLGAMRALRRYAPEKRGIDLLRLMMRSAINAMRSAQRSRILVEAAVQVPAMLAVTMEPVGSLLEELDAVDAAAVRCEARTRAVVARFLDDPDQRHRDIACRLGVSRSTVSRAFAEFADAYESVTA